MRYRADLLFAMELPTAERRLPGLAPAKTQPPHHPQPHHQSSGIVDVPPLAHAYPGMESDGALDYALSASQGDVQEVGVELKIDRRIQYGKQPLERLAAHELVGGSHVCERAPAKVLELE